MCPISPGNPRVSFSPPGITEHLTTFPMLLPRSWKQGTVTPILAAISLGAPLTDPSPRAKASAPCPVPWRGPATWGTALSPSPGGSSSPSFARDPTESW